MAGSAQGKELRQKLARLPDSCGVYIFKDFQGQVLYIGKAKSLKVRVYSYFSRYLSAKTQVFVGKICDIEYLLYPSEAQAELAEAALIKEHHPPYNTSLKDDKSFPLIRISQEKFPVISICRRKASVKEDRALYFGPYTDARFLRQALKMVRKIFTFRSCKKLPPRACLYYRLRLCPAPCIAGISAQDYQGNINQIQLFLSSKYNQLLEELTQSMDKAVESQDFERAAKLRDKIQALGAMGKTASPFSASDELEDLKQLLGLASTPLRIEAFDISNISGKLACGSLVSFYQGIADKNHYRRFRIKTVEGIDDYSMLREVISRRYLRVKEEKLPLPDLVLIDGGKGHLGVAAQEIAKLGLAIPLASIAKDKENIYIPGRTSPIKLKSDTPALNLIRRIRDEAHRFAIKYHHLLRRKKVIGR